MQEQVFDHTKTGLSLRAGMAGDSPPPPPATFKRKKKKKRTHRKP